MKAIERKEIVTPFLLPPKGKIERRGCFVPCLGLEEPILALTKLCKQLFPSHVLSSSSDTDRYFCSASPEPVLKVRVLIHFKRQEHPVFLRALFGL